jgi:IclR family transcriptional regulator, pca regulon regulatory protein
MPRHTASPDPKNVVQSLAKGFRVLEAFSASEPELTLAEVARRAGLDNATAFRLLNTLVMLGYVARVDATRRFRLSMKTLDLGFNAIARTDLRDIARPVLRSLVGNVNEAASLGVIDGSDVIYLERVQAGLARLGVDVRIGSRVPAYCSAIGHALLAWLPTGEQRRILDAQSRVKLTPATPVTMAEILRRLAKARRNGWVLSDQEVAPGLRVLAAPVLDRDGVPVAAVSVAAPSLRMPLQQFQKLATAPLLEAARTIARALEAQGAIQLTRAAA